MDVLEEKQFHGDVTKHWYYQSKAKALNKYIQSIHIDSVLDIGAGSGFFSKYLLKNTDIRKATCVDIAYKETTTECINDKQIEYTKEIVSPNGADLVLLMDVIEHIEDDLSFLKYVTGNVSSGTWFVVTVPAFQFLWSSHDEFLKHHRRYTLKSLRKLVANSGLNVKRINYFYASIFPLAAMMRLVAKMRENPKLDQSDLREHSVFVNSLLSIICSAETNVMNINKLAGLTVFCLCRKE